jgi:hypothetical protein
VTWKHIVYCYWVLLEMHGGVKVYRGAPSAARNYLDADRSRADDYYLVEGTGVARRFTAGPAGPVTELPVPARPPHWPRSGSCSPRGDVGC